jgi:O-antigen/teichoic acid export membrane protein
MSISKHTAFNIAGSLASVIVSVVTVPLYLRYVGLDRYGVLAICWLILGYFSVFDFGLGRAASQRIAFLVDADGSERSRVFWASLRITAGMAIVAMALLTPVCKLVLGAVRVSDPAMRREFGAALPWLVFCVPLGLMNSAVSGALAGRRAFLQLNLLTTLGSACTAVFPLVAAVSISPNLSNLIAASLLARLISSFLLFLACYRLVPLGRPTRPLPGELKGLLAFGGWVTVSGVIGPILVFWDRFVIGAIAGAAAVALYVVPFNFVYQVQILPNALASAMSPSFARGTAEERSRLTDRGLAFLSVLMTPSVLIGLLVAEPFLRLWIGQSRGDAAAPVTYLLLFGLWANAFARIPAVHLEARARPKVLARLHLAELVPYALLLLPAVRWYGIVGAAFVWSLRCTADALALFWFADDKLPKSVWVEALIIGLSLTNVMLMPHASALRWAVSIVLLTVGVYWVTTHHADVTVEIIRRAQGTWHWLMQRIIHSPDTR